jgi:DNA polymerase III subunit delta
VSDAERFFKGLEEGELPPVIAMGGPERAFVDDALRVLRERALAGAIVEFNHDRVAAKEVTCDGVISLAQTLPTMAPRRLVEVHDADALGEGGSDRLDAYLDRPAKETVLLFLFGEKMDARGKLAKSLKKRGAHMARFDHPRERDMPGLVRLRARRQTLTLSAEATEAIAITVGTDLVLLDRALEKLTLVADGREVSLEDIYEHVADTHLEDAFRLTRSLSDGDRAAALKSLAALEAARDEPLRLLGLFAWQLRRVLRARVILDGGGGEAGVGQAFSLYSGRARELSDAARRFEVAEHERRLLRVVQTDRSLKQSRASQWRWMERLVLELCAPPRPPVQRLAR